MYVLYVNALITREKGRGRALLPFNFVEELESSCARDGGPIRGTRWQWERCRTQQPGRSDRVQTALGELKLHVSSISSPFKHELKLIIQDFAAEGGRRVGTNCDCGEEVCVRFGWSEEG